MFDENNVFFVTDIHVKIENLARVLILGLITQSGRNMSREMFHGHALNRIQDIQILNSWWGDNSSNEMQKLQ